MLLVSRGCGVYRQLLTFGSVKSSCLSITGQQRMTMASFLIDDPKYSFLKDLGLEKTNNGVYNGKWFANGEVSNYWNFSPEKTETRVKETGSFIFCGDPLKFKRKKGIVIFKTNE